jgi:hypothetical protein
MSLLTSEKERRLCGAGIFRVAPEKEFFNRIGRGQASTHFCQWRSQTADIPVSICFRGQRQAVADPKAKLTTVRY